MIHSLRRLGVTELWVRWPDLDFLDAQVNLRVGELRHDVYLQLKNDFMAAQNSTVCVSQYVKYCELISSMAIELLSDRQNGLGVFASALFDSNPDLFDHCANVSFLAMTLGLRMEGYIIKERQRVASSDPGNLTNLGVGAMLHDIGKLQLPSTLHEHEPMNGELSDQYCEHPRRGARMIHERVGADRPQRGDTPSSALRRRRFPGYVLRDQTPQERPPARPRHSHLPADRGGVRRLRQSLPR